MTERKCEWLERSDFLEQLNLVCAHYHEQHGFAHFAALKYFIRARVEEEIRKEREACEECIPTTWLDPMLTGDKAVIGGAITHRDIERVFNACRQRIRARGSEK